MSAALERLRHAMERAERSLLIEEWLALAFAYYERVAAAGAPADDLLTLRQQARLQAELLRGRRRSRAGRLWTAQLLTTLFERFLADELEVGAMSEEAFADLEAGKARTLLDAMADPLSGRSPAGLSHAAVQAEMQLMRFAPATPDRSVLWQEVRLASLLPIGVPGGRDSGERLQALEAIEAEYQRLKVEPPEIAPIASLAEISAALAADEALIEYFLPGRGMIPAPTVWACVVTRNSAQAFRLVEGLDELAMQMSMAMSIDGKAPVDVSPLGHLIACARTAIRVGDDAAAAPHLAKLGEMLIGPLLAEGRLASAHRIIVVPHAELHYVPFAAITVGGRPLIDAFAFTYAPSASVWARIRATRRSPVSSLLGFANPELGYAHLRALPEAESELATIRARLPNLETHIYVHADATKHKLEQEARGKSIVHLATHGDFPEDNALDMQRILLAADDHHDGALHAEEVRRLDLRAARLVALSVCNGGLYRFGPGDEPYGLLPAVLAAGAENVVVSLWSVDDKIGRLLMTDIYARILDTGPADALRVASLNAREDGAVIRQWAAFAAAGCGRSFSAACLER